MKTIKDLPEHSRPREKLQERGPAALTDEELVAAILGRGMVGIDVRTMARQVAGHIREHKEKLTLAHLTTVPGIKLAKAAQILSAFELARRYLLKEAAKIQCAKDVLSQADKITIHNDGGCDANPGPGGWAALLRYGDHVRELTGGEGHHEIHEIHETRVLSWISCISCWLLPLVLALPG